MLERILYTRMSELVYEYVQRVNTTWISENTKNLLDLLFGANQRLQ